jgi:ATP-binding cassette subfamily B protein
VEVTGVHTRPGRDGAPAAEEDAAAGDAAAEALFGGPVQPGSGWAQHQWAVIGVSFLAVARALPRTIGQAVRLAWGADRPALLAVAVCEVGRGGAAAFGLLATNQVLLELLGAGPTPDRVRAALPALTLVVAAAVLASLMGAVSVAAAGRLEPRVERLANMRLLERAARVELAAIEDNAFHNLLESAQHGTLAARRMVGNSIGVLNGLIGLIAAAGVLGVLHPVLLPLLALIALPQGWGAVRSARRRYLSIKAWLEHARRQQLVADMLVEQEPAEEIRVHDAGRFLVAQYRSLAEQAEAEQARLARAEAGTTLVTEAVSGLATAATYAVLGLLLVTETVPLAVAGTAVLAIRTGSGNLGRLVDEVNRLYEQALFVLDLDAACRQADAQAIPEGGRPAPAAPESITTRGVGFTYPGASGPALVDVDLDVRRGQVVALVGPNGSGKTTLAKLIAGLYTPDSGTIEWDGVPTGELDRASLFDKVAFISQDFMRWPFTARVNVTIGRPHAPAEPGRLDAAARYGAAHDVVGGLPRGWNTLLARYFAGGVELSGGQWQRIALTRSAYREAPLLICDEPTAALDPRAEIEAFERIRAQTGAGRIVILITHRLASVRHADRIYVLEEGRVVESGGHAELMAAGGGYAQLYRLQACQYDLG